MGAEHGIRPSRAGLGSRRTRPDHTPKPGPRRLRSSPDSKPSPSPQCRQRRPCTHTGPAAGSCASTDGRRDFATSESSQSLLARIPAAPLQVAGLLQTRRGSGKQRRSINRRRAGPINRLEPGISSSHAAVQQMGHLIASCSPSCSPWRSMPETAPARSASHQMAGAANSAAADSHELGCIPRQEDAKTMGLVSVYSGARCTNTGGAGHNTERCVGGSERLKLFAGHRRPILAEWIRVLRVTPDGRIPFPELFIH
jgi:hypothetical protein